MHNQADPDPAIVEAAEATVILSEDRIDVATGRGLRMSAAIDGLRLVEFGIEKGRPVTLILVPESPDQAPQILTIPTDQYEAVAKVLLALAHEIAESPEG